MNITRLSIERPVVLIIFFVLIVAGGVTAYLELNYELVPKFNPPVITVVTIYPGAQAQQVEEEVSKPIEDALSSLSNIDVLSSTSRDNFSLVKLEMKAGTKVEEALNEANRKLLSIARTMPTNAASPVLTRFDFDDLPIIRLSAFAELSAPDLSKLCEEDIIPSLSQQVGVADIKLIGGSIKQLEIIVSKERLAATNTTILQVLQALGKNNLRIPTGTIDNADLQYSTVFDAQLTSIDEVRDLVLFQHKEYGILVQLRDVATVRFAASTPETISRLNGASALSLEIKKQSDANAVEVSEAVIAELLQLESKHEDLSLNFEVAQDTSIFTLQAARSVTEDLILAVVLVSVVMLVFLHSLRNAFIVFLSIPTSILATFIVMWLLGYSLNLLTLLGLSLAIGILVDDSIVVIENIFRHLVMGKPSREAAYTGRMEIGSAAISITLIDVVVFLPIVFTQGMVSDLLRQFSIVIVVSTLMSLLVSFTLVPYLASRLHHKFKPRDIPRFFQGIDVFLDRVISDIIDALKWSFRFPWAVAMINAILFSGIIYLFVGGWIGIEFTKAGDRSEFIVELSFKPGTPLAKTDEYSRNAERLILAYPFVETVFTSVGTTSSGRISTNTSHLSEMYIKLVDKSERDFKTSHFARHLKYQLMESIPGLEARPIGINIIGLRDDDAVQFSVLGEEKSKVQSVAQDLVKALDTIQGTIEVQSSNSDLISTISMVPAPKRVALLELEMGRAGMALRTAINGHNTFRYRQGEETYPIQIELNKNALNNPADLENLSILNSKGQHVPLKDFVDIQEKEVSDLLERTNRSRSVSVKSQVFGRPGGSVGREFRQLVEDYNVPDDIDIIYGGATKRTREGLQSMIAALIISVFLVYSILAILYNSFRDPLVILFSIPLAAIGAFLSLALSGEALSIFSIMGLIILIGLVGKNAILVVDFTKKLRRDGMAMQEALLHATKLRFRPILMTNLTMIIGLLPIALSTGAGSEWKNGLAWVLIGGLASSMFLSLIVVPLVYQFMHGRERITS